MPPSAPPPPSAVVEPALARALARPDFDGVLPVIVVLRRQAAPERIAFAATTRAEARAWLVAALQEVAERTQAPLRAYLEGARAAGWVESYTSFWIFNGLVVRARPSVIRALAARPEVAVLRLDHYRRWLSEGPQGAGLNPSGSEVGLGSEAWNLKPETAPEWNIARVRADEVWSALHISGTGAVVAGMDTGVDWLHPALQTNYRGYNPHGLHNHQGNWFDAVDGTLYPVDDHGHGTHTMGTAVGQGGIGVAPGAQWIAVKVLNGDGYGYDSWIHAGFQWLLAPGGDPAKAPDVVNCSWGNDNGYLTTFQADLRALRAAGIVPVFSNGNAGPGEGTVGSPASLPEAFAVGATDEFDEVANFSSRGPSPWGEVRPHIAAPGVHVRSSLPGGLYGTHNGTSMAAPHVSGLVALLRSVSPTLGITRMMQIITSTAVPLGDPIPNNDAGWGRVDAFAAVAALTQPGIVSGTVRSSADGAPVEGATVVAVPHGGGGGGQAATDAAGVYWMALAPSVYDLTASAFGYGTATHWGVPVTTDTTTVVDFALDPLLAGLLRVRVTDAATGDPLTATVAVLSTPLEAVGSTVVFTLPAGAYTVEARHLGFRVVTATAVVTAEETTTADLGLSPAPSLLLVDSGGWYYESQVGYFRQALDDLAYAYDEWPIRHLPGDLPQASDLAPYDIVVWSAPWDAPGYIGADQALTDYLLGGGRLLLTGQDVGFLDGGGWGAASYYRDLLKVYLVRDSSETWVLEGVPNDLFGGLTITITGSGGADNQIYPDEIAVADPDSAAPVLTYRGNGCGGVRVGTCLDYRAVYLSFGFEAINDRTARREVMGRALAWLAADPPTVGLELTPSAATRVGPPGSQVTYTLRIRHLGQAGVTDTVSLAMDGASWPVLLEPPSVALSSCASTTVAVTVTVPPTASWDARDVMTLTARSSISPTLIRTAVLTAKAPAPVLLVDDDRWYDQQERYRTALEAAGLSYDLWETCPPAGSCYETGPSPTLLQMYPIVVWWTGYDWYRPVTEDQEAALRAYLDQGGRLFFSSQDFLYYHHASSLSGDYLGVLTYTEDVTPLLAVGVPEHPIGEGIGPWDLDYPFRNLADGVEPTPGTAVILRDQGRRGIGLARREDNHAVVFFAFPFEALPEVVRPTVMERVVGWLSWLGGSAFTVDRGAVAPGGILTYALRLQSDGPTTVTASFSNTLPPELSLVSGSLTGPAVYDPPAQRLTWTGDLPPGAVLTVTYRATVSASLSVGVVISNPAWLSLDDQRIGFRRFAVVRVGTPDLSSSTFILSPASARPGRQVTATLRLGNGGPADAVSATAAVSLPLGTSFAPGSLEWAGGGGAEFLTGAVRWQGALSSGAVVTVTWGLTLPCTLSPGPLYSVAFLEDGTGGRWERPAWVGLEPWRVYLPTVRREG